MLRSNPKLRLKASTHRFAIVASKYNPRYVEAMLKAAKKTFAAAGATVKVVRVPGAFEIPVVAAKLAKNQGEDLNGIVCLGVILRGATTHAQHIGEAVSNSLATIQINFQVPIIHEVLLLENEQQAVERCLSATHNRGTEAAQTAIEMARVIDSLG